MDCVALSFSQAMKLRHAVIAAVFLLAGCAAITPPPRGEKILRDLVYVQRSTGPEHLDVYLPAGAGPFPVVIWFHGGGWKYGDKGWMLYLRELTQRGFAVVSVQYRLSGTAIYPAQLDDCRAALQWVEGHAASLRLDSRNIYLAGASAGAHLAAMLAEEKGRARIDAVCLLYPPTDLTGFNNQGARRGYLPELLGGPVIEKRAFAEAASPVNHVRPDSPPCLIFHGDRDTLVPIAQSHELVDRMRAAGVAVQLVTVNGKGHGFPLTESQMDDVAAFFNRYRKPSE
jgi:acetyl esterase/lipase